MRADSAALISAGPQILPHPALLSSLSRPSYASLHARTHCLGNWSRMRYQVLGPINEIGLLLTPYTVMSTDGRR